MKRTTIISFVLMGFLLLLPFANFSIAAPEDYVGVKVGDSFKWTLKVDADTFVEFAEDMGEEVPEEFEEIEQMSGFYLKAKVVTLTEKSAMVNTTLVDYVEVNCTMSAGIPGIGEEPSPYPVPIWVLSNETDYYLHLTLYALMEGMGEDIFPFNFLIVSHTLNWTKAIEDVKELYALNPVWQYLEVTQKNIGVNVTIPEGIMNASQKVMELLLQYNSDGVLTLGRLSYDGSMLMQLKLGTDEEAIPGYELPLIIGITTLTCTTIVYVINKKKKILK